MRGWPAGLVGAEEHLSGGGASTPSGQGLRQSGLPGLGRQEEEGSIHESR